MNSEQMEMLSVKNAVERTVQSYISMHKTIAMSNPATKLFDSVERYVAALFACGEIDNNYRVTANQQGNLEITMTVKGHYTRLTFMLPDILVWKPLIEAPINKIGREDSVEVNHEVNHEVNYEVNNKNVPGTQLPLFETRVEHRDNVVRNAYLDGFFDKDSGYWHSAYVDRDIQDAPAINEALVMIQGLYEEVERKEEGERTKQAREAELGRIRAYETSMKILG